jgi:hypothetical protein
VPKKLHVCKIKKNSFSKHIQIIEEIVEECNTFSPIKPTALFLNKVVIIRQCFLSIAGYLAEIENRK